MPVQPQILSYWEHYEGTIPVSLHATEWDDLRKTFPKQKGEAECFSVKRQEESAILQTSYFIGVDWIKQGDIALYVAPKLNTPPQTPKERSREIDFLKMLFHALTHADVAPETDELLHVDWEAPSILIEKQQDLLTPFLLIEFLGLMKSLVRRGVKKGYYRISRNLSNRIKGKVLVGQTIKQNHQQLKMLKTYCEYEYFGVDIPENRLLKKALSLVQRLLPNYGLFANNGYVKEAIHYIQPAFQGVGEEVNLRKVSKGKANPFYKEYPQAIKLAKLILKRLGHNLTSSAQQKVSTPPFWIDMSKLFELYVLGLLKEQFGQKVEYHFTTDGNELDFLLKGEHPMVIDAKYKPKYINGIKNRDLNRDLRQVSGYARLERVYKKVGLQERPLIDCLIIYPNQEIERTEIDSKTLRDEKIKIKEYAGCYKLGINLPEIMVNT